MDKLQKNKTPYGSGNKCERDFEDVVPVIEFSNISPENKDICIKLTKEVMSKYIFINIVT